MTVKAYKWNTGKYKWTDDMDEISHMGPMYGNLRYDDGGINTYEECCRFIVTKGLEFWDTKAEFNPIWRGVEDVIGLFNSHNADAEEFTNYINIETEKLFGETPTSLQFQGAVSHMFHARKAGWKKFKEHMINRRKEELAKPLEEQTKPVKRLQAGDNFSFMCANCGNEVNVVLKEKQSPLDAIQEHSDNCADVTKNLTIDEKAAFVADIIHREMKKTRKDDK